MVASNQSIKNDIDNLWLEFHTGGITNPLTVIEQITYLMFSRLLDIQETRNEKRAKRLNQDFFGVFEGPDDPRRWNNYKDFPADKLLITVRDKVFLHFRDLAKRGKSYGKYMENASLMVQKPKTLLAAVDIISKLPLTSGDTKGDLYEYMLSKLNTAGIGGQFRTPRHIIDLMVNIMKPNPDEKICDPACGTAGFLTSTMNYLQKKYTSKEGKYEEDGEVQYTGDLLEPYREHIQKELITGFDFDATMLRISAMNLMVHGIDNPNVNYQDTLGSGFNENSFFEANDKYDLILANPPFKGTIDSSTICPTLSAKVNTKKTELLFLVLILRMLNDFGRAAVIVPDGVLFGTSKAHIALRKFLIEENTLQGVISLPSGVFKPYAGVSTAILIFNKLVWRKYEEGAKSKFAGRAETDVWFYDLEHDGFSLDDKRTAIEKNDIPDCLEKWKNKDKKKDIDRSKKAFFVPMEEIAKNKYDLSINRYKEITYEQEEYDSPKTIIEICNEYERQIIKGLEQLKKEI